jgi:CheY-like chemotaxis protein
VCQILLVEDAPIVREPLARLLSDEGFRVIAAADGADAMAQLETQVVDLILLDVMMPHMNGLMFLERLRLDPEMRDIPVIAVTGVADSGQLARLRALGVNAILHKVRFSFDRLLEEIHGQIQITFTGKPIQK